eukprot:79835-Amphidinium_carterae.1
MQCPPKKLTARISTGASSLCDTGTGFTIIAALRILRENAGPRARPTFHGFCQWRATERAAEAARWDVLGRPVEGVGCGMCNHANGSKPSSHLLSQNPG